MNLCRKITKQNHYIALIMGAVFLLQLILIPPVYSIKSMTITGTSIPGIGIAKHTSFFVAVLSDNEVLTDVVTYHIINRNLQPNRPLPNLIFYALAVLLVGYGILIHICKYDKQQTDQSACELAFSKGGHAPPLSIYDK